LHIARLLAQLVAQGFDLALQPVGRIREFTGVSSQGLHGGFGARHRTLAGFAQGLAPFAQHVAQFAPAFENAFDGLTHIPAAIGEQFFALA
jgi:hypothetical protein